MASHPGVGDPAAPTLLPGAERPRRFLPRLRYELVGCGLHGHELVRTDLADIPEDYRLVALGAC